MEDAGIEPYPASVNHGPDKLNREKLIDDLDRLGDEFCRPPKFRDVDVDALSKPWTKKMTLRTERGSLFGHPPLANMDKPSLMEYLIRKG